MFDDFTVGEEKQTFGDVSEQTDQIRGLGHGHLTTSEKKAKTVLALWSRIVIVSKLPSLWNFEIAPRMDGDDGMAQKEGGVEEIYYPGTPQFHFCLQDLCSFNSNARKFLCEIRQMVPSYYLVRLVFLFLLSSTEARVWAWTCDPPEYLGKLRGNAGLKTPRDEKGIVWGWVWIAIPGGSFPRAGVCTEC